MNLTMRPSTPPLLGLDPNCVGPKPVPKSPPEGPGALMESWAMAGSEEFEWQFEYDDEHCCGQHVDFA